MVLLHSAGVKGSCYIETKSLDGETNLKTKKPVRELQEVINQDNTDAISDYRIKCKTPDHFIYTFDAMLIQDKEN
eukprot:CAMPEP_0116879022 /NCGR_PEP_ID=MMETSP0463-20121206/10774_1 /TAXON_ID=181622 /ORGANISM="Strombidinopsis sp, Strain SopsisLIS2011" /LENGTH=74 /DNA_ID=CAMNT_0004527831 /DNA_START=453 /DNA_END=677 /DNA_ORIENTATION=+